MILKLDEKQIPITNFYETLVERAQMTATNSFEVGAGAEFPDLTGVEGLRFTVCKVLDGMQEIPLIGTYRMAEAVNAAYDAKSKIYTVNIVLTGGAEA